MTERSERFGISTIWRFFGGHRITLNKKIGHAVEQDRPDVLKRRREWFEDQIDLEPERLIFIDETWASTNMARRYGRAGKGERLRAGIPFGHWKTTTFVAGLRLDGIVAPMVIDAPINGRSFRTYVEKVLIPELRSGDIVIMDNLGSHKAAVVRDAIKAAGARLWFLPPCSPDLNPIEQAFAKIKHWMRMAQQRTVDDTWRHLGSLILSIPPEECSNYFRNSGYASIKI